jgi:hypothetical protein
MEKLPWVTSRGQTIQIATQIIGLLAGAAVQTVVAAMMQNMMGVSLDWWVLGVTFVVAALAMWWVSSVASKMSQSRHKPSLFAGYDRVIPARSRQDGIEEGYEKAKQIWAASIAGVYFSHLRDEDRKKVTQVLLVDPDSVLMETLIRIQSLRGEDMPGSVKRAVKICKDEKIEVRLSSHPLLNVVLFDPGTPHAWARVQEFIPYFPGEESAVYAIRKEEWEDLYNKIESSFKQAWKNGRDPIEIH